MRIYFGTNRNPNSAKNPTDFGNAFSQQGLTDLRFGWADITSPKLDAYQLNVEGEKLDVGLAKAKVGDFSGQKLGSVAVFEAIRKEMSDNKQDCLILIHGYNTSFSDAIKAAAKMKAFYGDRPMVFFLFTWPSDGSLLPFKAYASDRDDARASGAALGRGLQKFASFLSGSRPEDYCGQKVHLAAHSMGNYALRFALENIRKSTGSQLRRLLDQILLFAADEDDDTFEYEHKLLGLPDIGKRVTVYHNPKDRALVVSDYTKGNPDRLGASGPRNSRALPDKVTVVNCEPAIRGLDDLTMHNYYLSNPSVRKDALGVLDGLSPQDLKTREYQPDTRSYRLKIGVKK